MELYTAGTGNGQRAAIRGQRMRCPVHDARSQPGAGRSEEARLSEDKPDRPHPDPDRSRRPRRLSADPDPVLGHPLLPGRKDRPADPERSSGARPDLPMAWRSSERHGADRAEAGPTG